MVTIEDVARQAGVSRSTVSYALSGKRSISDETKRRIESAIDQLGFTVNAGARALATAQTMVLALFLQFNEDEFPPATLQYILGVTGAARREGYDILMVNDPNGAAAVKRVTQSGMADGVILLDVAHDDPRIAALRQARQPAALVGLPRDTEGVDVFDLDFSEAGRLLVDHLHGLGHREVLLISPPRHVFERGAAYAWRFRDAALERAAQRGMVLRTFYGEAAEPHVTQRLNDILDSQPSATGLIVHNDATIAALPAILRVRNVDVPRDLSVVSLYPRDFGQTFLLPYTAIETSPDELGRLAVQQLVRRIGTRGKEPSVVRFVEPKLVVRGSTA